MEASQVDNFRALIVESWMFWEKQTKRTCLMKMSQAANDPEKSSSFVVRERDCIQTGYGTE